MKSVSFSKLFSSVVTVISGYLSDKTVANVNNVSKDSNADVDIAPKDSEESNDLAYELRILAKAANYAGPKML